jgi:hypothetical protein
MGWTTGFRLRLTALLRRRRLDRDLEEELGFHMAMREEKLRESGLSAEDASHSAHRRFGNPTGVNETCRDLWTFPSLERGRQSHSSRLGQGPIVLQVALSLVLIVGAGLFVRTLWNLRNVELGFRSEGVLLFGLDPTLNGYKGDRLLTLYRNLLDRLQSTPGVISAAASRSRVLSGWRSNGPARVAGATWLPKNGIQVNVNQIGPRFFDTMGIPIRLGRGPSARDTANAPRVAFISQNMAQRAFPSGSPLGRTISLFGRQEEYEVAGVVAATRLIASFLHNVAPRDARTFAASAAVLILVALLAAYLPARRAARINPIAALRCE